MPPVPSIKATGFQSAADDAIRMVESGRLSRGELENQLEPQDLQYLGKQLAASAWVPIDTYERVVEMLIALEAGHEVDHYLRQRGWRAAERLHKLGLYGQFDATLDTWGHRVGTITATMAAVVYNFTRWSVESDIENGVFEVIVDDAHQYPEILRVVGEGFIHYLAQNLMPDKKVAVTSDRVTPDRIVFCGKFESS